MIDVTTIATLENLETYSKDDILDLYNTLLKAQGKKARKKVTPKDCFSLLQQTRGEDPPKEEKPTKAKESKPRGPSYQEKLRKHFDAEGFGSKTVLMEVTGADSKNLSVAVSILKNPARCKDTRDVVYLRGIQTYYCVGNKKGADQLKSDSEALEAGKKEAADEKKAKDKAKKEAKAAEKAEADAKAAEKAEAPADPA